MNKIIEIQKNDFVKYLKCIYLVKGFKKLDSGNYQLEYYFRSIKKENAELHTNKFDMIYDYLSEKIKKPTSDEIKFLKSKIKSEYPNFDISFLKTEIKNETLNLNVNDCIAYLKNKGFLVFKQI